MEAPYTFHVGQSDIRVSLLDGIEIISKVGPNDFTKHFTTQNIVRNAMRRSFTITVKRIPFIGFLFCMILVFIRLVKSPLSSKNWCIAIMEMASGAISLLSSNVLTPSIDKPGKNFLNE